MDYKNTPLKSDVGYAIRRLLGELLNALCLVCTITLIWVMFNQENFPEIVTTACLLVGLYLWAAMAWFGYPKKKKDKYNSVATASFTLLVAGAMMSGLGLCFRSLAMVSLGVSASIFLLLTIGGMLHSVKNYTQDLRGV